MGAVCGIVGGLIDWANEGAAANASSRLPATKTTFGKVTRNPPDWRLRSVYLEFPSFGKGPNDRRTAAYPGYSSRISSTISGTVIFAKCLGPGTHVLSRSPR